MYNESHKNIKEHINTNLPNPQTVTNNGPKYQQIKI